MNVNVISHGSEATLPERLLVRAGPLSMIYSNGDLRYIRYGGREIVRRIYVAARDSVWDTAVNRLSNVRLDIGPSSFEIRYECENLLRDIDFAWTGHITGGEDGRIEFRMEGQARQTFRKNRLGFCILHPAHASGSICMVEHIDGASEPGKLPRRIVPDQPVLPFADMRGYKQRLDASCWLEMKFFGDTFEMEDQRNWTDASFKTFCTPLSIPFPVTVGQGASISQAVTLSLTGLTAGRGRAGSEPSEVTFSLRKTSAPLPKLGLGMATHGRALSIAAVSRLRQLHPHHLRVDLDLSRVSGRAYAKPLSRAIKAANALNCALEVGLLIQERNAHEALAALRKVIDTHKPRIDIAHWLVYPHTEHNAIEPALAPLVAAARRHLSSYNKKSLFAAGTNADFINAARYPAALARAAPDAVCVAITPQIHAFDVASISETPPAQATVVESAAHMAKMAKGKPVLITPVTLKARWNAYVPADTPASAADATPGVDPRQASLFGAGFTLASIKYLAQAGAAAVTYYETTGTRGLMADGAASVSSDWPVSKGVYPVWHVFADIAEFGGAAVHTASSDPLAVEGLALRRGRRLRIMLANLTGERQIVAIRGLGARASVRMLNAENAERAILHPGAFRGAAKEALLPHAGKYRLELPAFGLATIDGTGNTEPIFKGAKTIK